MSDLTPARLPEHRGDLASITSHPTQADYNPEPAGEGGLGLRDVVGVLRRNVWLILATTLLAFAATAYLVSRERPQYRANAMVRLVDVRAAMTGGLAEAATGGGMGMYTDPVQSQLLVLTSPPVLGEVVDREGLRLRSLTPELPTGNLQNVKVTLPHGASDTLRLQFDDNGVVARLRADQARGAYGAPLLVGGVQFAVPAAPAVEEATLLIATRDEAVDLVGHGLTARPRESTDGVDIQFTSPDPRLSLKVVNAVAEVFQTANARAAQQQAVRRRVFLDEQIRDAERVLAEAQLGLTRFRSGQQLYNSSERLTAQQGELMQLEMRREEMDAERRLYQSLLTQLTQSSASTSSDNFRALMSAPGIAGNPAISQLFAQLVQYQTGIDSLTTGEYRKTETNPEVTRLRTLIASTEARLISAVRGHVATLEARVASLDQMRSRSGTQMQRLPSAEAEELRLAQQVETARLAGEQLRAEHQKARLSEAVEAGQVEIVNLASQAKPVNSNRPLKLGLGLMFGLMLGAGSAFLKEQLNTSIRRREDIESALQIPGLAVIPQIAPAPRRGLLGSVTKALPSGNGKAVGTAVPGLITARQLRSSGAEAFRTLRTNLVFSQAVRTLRTLVVTSTSPGEGKSTVAANLAVTFAQQGGRVLLVDCDLRRPRLDKMFPVPREPGLTNVLLEQSTLEEAVHVTMVDNLHLLTAGLLPPNPYELLGGERMKRLFAVLSNHYDMLVVDTPPLMAASDAAVLGAMADGVLMVVRAGSTDRGAAQHATQQLATVGARVVGAVLNDPDATVEQYGGYYYNYSYSEQT